MLLARRCLTLGQRLPVAPARSSISQECGSEPDATISPCGHEERPDPLGSPTVSGFRGPHPVAGFELSKADPHRSIGAPVRQNMENKGQTMAGFQASSRNQPAKCRFAQRIADSGCADCMLALKTKSDSCATQHGLLGQENVLAVQVSSSSAAALCPHALGAPLRGQA